MKIKVWRENVFQSFIDTLCGFSKSGANTRCNRFEYCRSDADVGPLRGDKFGERPDDLLLAFRISRYSALGLVACCCVPLGLMVSTVLV